jgi:succinate dehydrogenase / fumarate reductase membrane anchor subunit
MVKSVLGVNHQGLRDWLVQRVSAVVMAIYFTALVIYFLSHPHIDFVSWHALFAHSWMKVATILCVTALLFHAWVGMWTIFTDYVKIYGLAILLNVLVFLALAACFFWTLLILWGV